MTPDSTPPTPDPADRSWVLELLDDEGRPRHRFPLAPGRHALGSAPDPGDPAAVTIPGPGVSRRHAWLDVGSDGSVEIVDRGSKNGTVVEGERIERRRIDRGARLHLGGQPARLRPGGATGGELGLRTAPAAIVAPRAAGSTLGTSLAERLLRSLRGRLAGGPGAAAELAAAWLAELPIDRVEFRRRGFVVARAERQRPEVGVEREVAGPADWSLVCGAPSRRTLELLAEGFALALEILAAGRATGSPRPSREPAPPGPPRSVHPGLRRLYGEASQLAQGTLPLLLLGESGSGKEVLARFLHEASPRAIGPFVAINCAALPNELLEAELFGIEKGVATGVEARPGLLERARGGTLLLDEIGDLPLPLQAKVLRVLEGAPYYRVGGRQALTAEVRFVAATHVDLPRKVAEGGFRRDLYFRLSAAPLALPPLRARREDVPLLAAEFFAHELAARGIDSPGLTRAALGALLGHDWPGNVRELRHEIARAVLLLAPGEPLDVHHLRPALRGAEPLAAPLSLAAASAEAERTAFRTALALAAGDPVQARTLLGVSRTTYYRKWKELGLDDATPELGTNQPPAAPCNPESGA